MNENSKNAVNASMLERIYKNVTTGSESVVNIMSKTKDSALREELTSQLNKYEAFSREASRMMYDVGRTPKEEGVISRVSAKMGVAMNTMTDSSPSHLAQLVIEGAAMGMTDMTKILRDYENKNCSESALSLARNITSFEDDSMHRLKNFL